MKLIFFLVIALFLDALCCDVDPGYTVETVGYSEMGAPIQAIYNASTVGLPPVLVILDIHGDEAAGYRMGLRLLSSPLSGLNTHVVWVPTMNPDGLTYGLHTNINGIDLNRAFGDRCNRTDTDATAEAEAMKRLIAALRPLVIVSYHMGAAVVVWGADQDCNSTALAVKAPMSPFEESLDTYWAARYAHHWGKGDESRTIQGSAMYQIAGSLIEYAVPTYAQVGLVVEMDRHKAPNDVLEEIVESQHRAALLSFLDEIGRDAVTTLPPCLANEPLFARAAPGAAWFLTHGSTCPQP